MLRWIGCEVRDDVPSPEDTEFLGSFAVAKYIAIAGANALPRVRPTRTAQECIRTGKVFALSFHAEFSPMAREFGCQFCRSPKP